MKTFTAVFSREVAERRMIFPVAAILAVLPFVTHLLPGLSHRTAVDARTTFAVIASLAFGAGCAIALGANMLSRDIAERKLGFYLSRPIGSTSLWSGKLLAAWFLALAGGAIVMLPSVFASAASWERGVDMQPYTLAAILVVSVLVWVPLAHAGSTAIRSRSAWILADIAALAVVSALGYVALRRMLEVFAFKATIRGAIGILVVLFLGLVVSGAVQVEKGRNEIRRSHRVYSLVFWSIALLGVLATDLFSRWIVSPSFSALSSPGSIIAAPRGDWAAITGTVPSRGGDHYPLFLVNVRTREARRISGGAGWLPDVVFSRDGGTVVFAKPEVGVWPARSVSTRLMKSDLASGRQHELAVLNSPWISALTVSSDASRVAWGDESNVSVLDSNTRRIVAVASVGGRPAVLTFLSPDTLRIFSRVKSGDRGVVEMRDFNVNTRMLSPAIRFPFESTRWMGVWVNDESTLVRLRSAGETEIFDTSGRKVMSVAPDAGHAHFLTRNRIAVLRATPAGSAVELHDATGALVKSIVLPPARSAHFGPMLDGGTILVGLNSRPMQSAQSATEDLYAVDLESGAVVKKSKGIRWAGGSYSGVERASDTGSVSSRLFIGTDDSLVSYDVLSGESTTLVKGNRKESAVR